MLTERELSNGIHVLTDTSEVGRCASFGIWIRVGSVCEDKKNNGISHVIEHMMFKGTKRRSAADIADETARLGGNLNAYTGKEATAFYLTTLDEQLFDAMDLISDMIKNSVIAKEHLETEKKVILDEISMYDDSCEDMVHEKLQKKIWKDHPLGFLISGKKKNVKKYTAKEILAYKKKWYVGSRMVIAAAGHFDTDVFMDKVEELFGDIPKGEFLDYPPAPAFRTCSIRKFRDIEQVHLDIAMPGISECDEKRYIFTIANSIYGGSVSSRLFQKIREEDGRAYSIYSYGSSYLQTGLWQIYAATNPEMLEATFDEIIRVSNQLKETGITEEELRRAKEELRSELIIGSETAFSRCDNLARSYISHGRVIPLKETEEALLKVTKEEINEFLRERLDMEHSSVCVMGNCET